MRVKHKDIHRWQWGNWVLNALNGYWLPYNWGTVATIFTIALAIILMHPQL